MTTETTLITVREACTKEIKSHLESIGASYLKVGSLLNELRSDFEGQKEFLAYVADEFGIKKAQCYNLMNVARTFDGDERFQGVAMRVMLALIPLADDAQIMEQAAALAFDGKLDTKAVNALTGKPEKSEPKASQPQANTEKVAEVAAEEATQAMQEIPEESNDLPWEDDADDAAPVEAVKPTVTTEAAPDATMAAMLDELKRLREDNAALQARLVELTSTRETKKASAPMLPQFKSACMYARLGLSVEEATKKTAVNKAKRELVKLGYGEGHEAWAFISEAVEALTK